MHLRPCASTALYVGYGWPYGAFCGAILGEAAATTRCHDPLSFTLKMKPITAFTNIHSHGTPGEDCVVSLPFGAYVPDDGYFSVGVHPWDTGVCSPEDLARIDEQAARENVVAIGECGLDALRGAPLDVQERIFKHHIALSERLGKPLVIHAVRTLQRILELRKELHPRQRWIIHGFRGGKQLALSLLKTGIDLSFGLRYNPESYEATPPERRFHETD